MMAGIDSPIARAVAESMVADAQERGEKRSAGRIADFEAELEDALKKADALREELEEAHDVIAMLRADRLALLAQVAYLQGVDQ